MNNSTITKTAFFAVPRETVWAFLTEADKLAQWFHPARQDLQANQDYELYLADNDDGSALIWGTVLEWEPPAKLTYTFCITPLQGKETTVSWFLQEFHNGTRLTLTHEGVGELGDSALGLLMALDDGWDEHIGKLRTELKNADHAAPSCTDTEEVCNENQ